MRKRTRTIHGPLYIVSALALASCVVGSQQDARTASIEQEQRRVLHPAGLTIPEGNRHAFDLSARGVQVYACSAGADGVHAWTLVEPDAELFDASGCKAGDHYAGPTWESIDGSAVVAAKLAEASVDPAAIPWLLVKATGHTARGRMAKVTYIQRIDTRGGRAPREGCDALRAGATQEVPYTARYAFFRAAR